MRTWSNQRGEGKLFSIDLLDEHGGQIRATMFNDSADKFFPVLQEGKVYTFTRGNLKPANKKYSKLPHDFEIHLNRDAEINFYGEDSNIKEQHYEFKKLQQIQDMPVETIVDVCGVVSEIQPLSQIVSSRTQKELTKRTITICDDSGASIHVTLWNDKAEELDEKTCGEGAILALKSLRVGDFSGRSLGTTFSSNYQVNPNIPETKHLQEWYRRGGASDVVALSVGGPGGGSSRRISLCQIKDEKLGMNDKPDYFEIRSTLIFFKQDMDRPPWYTACPTQGCNKKVTELDNEWRCEKCDRTHPTRKLRYILTTLVADYSGSQWLTAFNDEAEKILYKTAEELKGLIDLNNEEEFKRVFNEANFKQYIFSCRAKVDTSGEEIRTRVTISRVKVVDPLTESKNMLKEIAKYDNL